jgi:alkylation response protein AidB-like acyl-CoA dehydrogenase
MPEPHAEDASAPRPAAPPATRDEAAGRAREVAAGVARETAAEVDAQARWPAETIRALQAAGLGGLVVPRGHGGADLGMEALVQVCEIVGRECASSAICFGMHCVGAAVIAAKATDDQVERYLAPICAGRHLTTLALSEPGTGAHFYLPQTEFVPDGADGFRVRGTKTFVTNGRHADSYVVSGVTAADGDPAAAGRFSCLVLRDDADGLAWGGPWRGLGMRGNSSRTLELEDVRAPRRDLLGGEGDQLWYVFHVVAPYFLMAMSGTYLGVAAAALDEARAHLQSRVYGFTGRTLASEPVLQHRFGVLWGTVERTRRLVQGAAAAADAGDPDALAGVLTAKAEVADCAVQVTNEAMTLAGGIGYGEQSRLHRHLRDARAAHVMSPTTDLLRTWAGRALLDQPLLSG